MSATQTCPQCGAKPVGGAFEGLCPKCVVQVMRGIPMVVPVTEQPGDRIGRYKLLQKIGEGGCGVVYMAEQEEPVRRKVALKVIKLGMDTKQFVARFEAERQALALMDHPNIAKVFDAGSTDTGRPFFVMELVRGIKITDYCNQNQLSTIERLALFIQVCQAVQHAHQKGIIHRDLKPSNILVAQHDTVAVPKVIDFGLAKATSDQRLTDKTLFTAFEQFVGTPAYMSPEQAQLSGLDLDTRTDIYSLGVLLYELLTGQPPFDPETLLRSGLDEMRRTIRETEPVRPSTRLTQELVAAGVRGRKPSAGLAIPAGAEVSAAARRRLRLKEQIDLVRGDLDWIVMKCLEKDRARRYETANGLAADLQCHLSNEPVVARPPSAAYRLQKLVRRNKLVFAAVTSVATALVLGTLVSTWQAVRATRAQWSADTARHEEAQSRRRAERGEMEARQKAYASDMNLAQQALAQNNLGRAQELLNRHRPAGGQESGVRGQGSVARGQESGVREQMLDRKLRRSLTRDPGLLTPAPRLLTPDLRGWEWRYLWQQCRSDALFALCQQSNAIFSLTVSPDGKWLAIGEGDEGRLTIWDWQKREEIARFPADVGPVFAAFAPRGRLLAFSSGAGWPNHPHRVRIWDGVTNRIVAELENPCRGLAFSGDGETLATLRAGSLSAGREGEVALWQVPEGRSLARHAAGRVRWNQGHPFAIAPDVSVAAYAVWTDGIRVVDLRTGQERWRTNLSDFLVTTLAISPDGKTLAAAGGFAPSPIQLWNLASGEKIAEGSPAESERGYVCSLVFSPDGKTLASGGSDQVIRVWDTEGMRLRRRLQGHKSEVWSLVVLPDNRTLVSGCKDGSVFVWDMAASRHASPQIRWPENLMTWSFATKSTNSQTMLTCDRQGRVAQWTGSDFVEERLFEIGTNLMQAAFLPGGSTLLARSINKNIQVWDLQTLSFSRELPLTSGPPAKCFFMAQGNRLIIGNLDRQTIHEIDFATGRNVRTWRSPAQLRTGAISPDAQWCITFGLSGGSMINDLNTGLATEGSVQIKEVHAATFSADGKWLATASGQGFARIWDAATLQPVPDLRGFMQGVSSVTFSPDGHRLVTGSDGKEAIKLWDLESHEELLTLEGQGSNFSSPAFSPDGAVLGSMNANGVLHLWRAPSWEEIAAEEKGAGK